MARNPILFSLLILLASTLVGISSAAPRKTVGIYELRKGNFSVKVTNWGAIITSVVLPDAKGKLDDVVLGFDTLVPYVNNPPYFGALVGRVANRISGAQFTLNGHKHKLFANDGNNSLHGGHRGFSKVIWTVKDKKEGDSPYITFYYHSFDGEQGFPGDLDVFVTYQIVRDYEFSVSMHAKPGFKPTPVNLVQHTYWNLDGHDSSTILSNTVQIFGDHITPVDEFHIPTGKITPVAGTPFDFLRPNTVGGRIKEAGGYDINYVLSSPFDGHGMRKAAVARAGKSGRVLELWTNQKGVQFYTANTMQGVVGKGGRVYGNYAALCLETQGFPNSVNQPNFPSQIVYPGEVYKHHMLFKFSFA